MTKREIIARARTNAFDAINIYLYAAGWTDSKTQHFLMTDPVTGFPHRSDFAFIVQSERDIYMDHGLPET